MPSMMTCLRLGCPDVVQRMRDDYLRTLVAPMDGMWEKVVIAHAVFWDIRERGRHAGYACVGPANALLRFHLAGGDGARARETFRWFVAAHGIRRAIAGTIEPPYLSLCLAHQRGIALHSYLFRDHTPVATPSGLGDATFRTAEEGEFDAIARFYHTNTEGPGAWIGAFLRERLARGELFGLYDRQGVLATGECIPNRAQPPYADLGMVVAWASRGRGLGSAMLARLKEHCYDAGWQPICSCAADNSASKKAIEKAGFISEHCMLEIVLQEEDITHPFLSGVSRHDDRSPDESRGTL